VIRFLEEKEEHDSKGTDELSTIRRSEVATNNKIEEENHCKACREALK
jgi:hypothetical protein